MNKIMQSDTFMTTWMSAGLQCSTVQEALNIAIRASRFDQAILSVFVNRTSELPHIWCTLSGEWLSYYLRRSFYSCDAVAQAGAARSKPFFWSDLKVEGSAREFMEESAQHGIGPSGYSKPLVGPAGQRTLLSIASSTMSDKDWRYYIRATGKELQEFAKFLRSRALDEIEQKPSVAAGWRSQPTTLEQSSQIEPLYAIANTAMDHQPSRL